MAQTPMQKRYWSDPEKYRAHCRKYRASQKGKEYQKRAWHIRYADPVKRISCLVRMAMYRAKKRNHEFDEKALRALQVNPPSVCPCCGDNLDYSTGRKDNKGKSPSIDRFDSSKGYIEGNIVIICTRCNLLKGDACITDLEKIIQYIRRGPLAASKPPANEV